MFVDLEGAITLNGIWSRVTLDSLLSLDVEGFLGSELWPGKLALRGTLDNPRLWWAANDQFSS